TGIRLEVGPSAFDTGIFPSTVRHLEFSLAVIAVGAPPYKGNLIALAVRRDAVSGIAPSSVSLPCTAKRALNDCAVQKSSASIIPERTRRDATPYHMVLVHRNRVPYADVPPEDTGVASSLRKLLGARPHSAEEGCNRTCAQESSQI